MGKQRQRPKRRRGFGESAPDRSGKQTRKGGIPLKVAERPVDEQERLRALLDYELLDTPPEEAIDDLTRIVSQLCGTPVALVSLIDTSRQWFKSRIGVNLTETCRDVSFCSHAILRPETM